VKGDSKARKELYDLFAPGFLSLCHRYAKSPEDARDVFQEGFIKIFENLHSLKDPRALPGWMKRIFVNEALKMIGKNSAHMMVDLSGSNYPITSQYDVIDQLEVGEITAIITRLPDKMRITFNMYAIEGYSHAEIAGALGISVGTSKSNLHDARRYIQRELEKMRSIKKNHCV